MEDLRLYCATYNVGTSSPDQELYDFLGLSIDRKNEKFHADFYVISLQEVKAQPQNMLMDALFVDPWTNAMQELLEVRDYVKLKTIRLQGLLLSLYCLRKHLLNVRYVEADYTRTGLSGMWGNKGAVSIRLSIYGCSMCFVNSHLSAHDNKLQDRIDDYNSIIKDQEFHVAEHTEIFYHDYVFWMGDLNFRIREEYEKTPEEIDRMIAKRELKELLDNDQLKYVMRKGEAFSELKEQDPDFPPTFKFEVGTSQYDYKRRPAWCDRILHRVNQHNYENVTLQVEQLSYKSHPAYVLSDHKPVTAEFKIKIPGVTLVDLREAPPVEQVFADFNECIVKFDKIVKWVQDNENKAIYKVTKHDIAKTNEDWIGLFKDKFSSLDDYVCYEYVSKSEYISIINDEADKSVDKYEITFSELPSRCRGHYRLVYFSQSEDKVFSVLGVSDAFPIVSDDSD